MRVEEWEVPTGPLGEGRGDPGPPSLAQRHLLGARIHIFPRDFNDFYKSTKRSTRETDRK